MKYFTGAKNPIPSFVMFSTVHLITLAILVISYFLLYLNRNKFKSRTIDRAVRYSLAAILISMETGTVIFNLVTDSWMLATSLPLQLCDILVILSSLLLMTKSYQLYEFVYLLGLAGATQALITPDLIQGFPTYQFFLFFVSHGLIIFSALYMTFVHDYRPNLRSIYRTYIGLNLSLPIIGLVNFLTGGDYFFLAGKPETASLLDYLGPWPWYILSLEIVAVILLCLSYLPFVIKDIVLSQSKKKTF